MDLASCLLGLAGIALGYNTLAKGAQRLAEGVATPGRGVPAGVRTIPGRVPTMVIPRSATRKMPPLVSRGAQVKTRTGMLGASTYKVENLNDRIAVIIDRIEKGTNDPKMIAWARQQVSQRKPGSTEWNGGQWQCPEKDGRCELEKIFMGTRRSARYVSDPVSKDTYASPAKALQMGGFDCDEYTAVVCSAARAIGKRCEVVVIETKDSKDGPNHVFGAAYSDGKRYPMDASVSMPFGWEAPDSMVRRRWVFQVD